jgi:hypothetical protein
MPLLEKPPSVACHPNAYLKPPDLIIKASSGDVAHCCSDRGTLHGSLLESYGAPMHRPIPELHVESHLLLLL